MLGKKCKSIAKLPCCCVPNSDCVCLGNLSQVASETVHARKLAAAAAAAAAVPSSLERCLEEEEKVCKCDNNISTEEELFKSSSVIDKDIDHAATPRVNANSSFSSVIDKDIDHAATPRVNANSSFAHAVINMVGMLIGLVQLSTPYALQNGGWSSAFLLVGLGIVCAYSSHLLGKCLSNNPKLMNYTDIGHHAFGTKGRLLAASFIYMEIFMSLVSYTISLHDNLNTVFFGAHFDLPSIHLLTSQLLTVIAVLVALPSLWLKDLSSIAFLSTGGIFMSLIIFTMVALTPILGGVKVNREIPILRVENIPAISGLYIFSFSGHSVFPNIHKEMKDPSKFTKVSIVSFTLVTLLYTALAFMGAKMFGPEVNSQITLSMPRNLLVTKIALWATVLTPMTKYALEFAPFAMHLDHHLSHSMNMKSRTRTIVRGSVGSFLLLIILALALAVPYFEYVLSLTGSLVSVAICIIFPCAFYTKVFWNQISRPLIVLNGLLIVLGCLLAVSGTISSSKLLIRDLHRAHSP